MSDFASKTIAITGVSSGIGAATARLLTARGATIVGFDRNPPTEPVARFIALDQADPASIEAALGALDIKLDALVNSAGVPPTADKHAVLRINFFGQRHFNEVAAAHFADGAAIVNVASLAGFDWRANIDTVKVGLATSFADADAWIAAQPLEGGGSYFLSKQLVIAWTIWNAARWADRGIRVNAVSPGPVSTPILKDFIATLGQRVEDDLRENRAGTAEEIAPVIAFLCSDEARWINGADIAVDYGAGAKAWQGVFA